MDLLLSLVFIVGGFVLLIKGADWLVGGGTSIAQTFKVSDLVIGLTIVSFGTSAPELIVNVIASLNGSADLAVSNIIGSNISNTLLILGATALISHILVQKSTVFKEIPFSILAACVLFILANDAVINGHSFSEISRGDGLVLIGFFAIFMYYVFGISKENTHEHATETSMSGWKAALLVLGGIIGLATGGDLVVRGAVQIASQFGVSETLIGLTIVALGTSLPELVASIVAALKGKPDMAVGNIIGSNIFNVFWIIGVSAIIRPLPYDINLNADTLFMIGTATLLFLFINTGTQERRFYWRKPHKQHLLTRSEGGIMIGLYIAYMVYIIWRG